MSRIGRQLIVPMVLASMVVGCASKPQPKSVSDATSLLARVDTEELEALRPSLIEEAREYEAKARHAFDSGDDRAADLYGNLAVQRWKTAQNFVRRDSAQALIKRMIAARDRAAGDEARRRAELDRLKRLLSRIDALAAPKPTDDSALIAAKKALLEARRKQAEADAVGASLLAPNPYNQGTTLLGAAVESLQLNLISESTTDSAGAIAAFTAAIEQAKAPKPKEPESAVATTTPTPPSPATPAASAPLLPEESLIDISAAQRAIYAAEDARADALGRGGVNDPAMDHGNALLEVARRAKASGDSERAIEKAKDARQVFAMVRGTVESAHSAADNLIVALEARRIELLAAGSLSNCPSYEAFQVSIDTAKSRLQAKDQERALEFAIRAQERLRECERGSGFGTTAKVSEKATPTAAEKQQLSADDQAKKRAASAIQKAQASLAEAKPRNAGDPRLDTAVQLLINAEAWYDRKEWAEAEDLANRASKELDDLLRRPAAKPTAAPPTTTPPGKEPTAGTEVTADQAAAAIADAQRNQVDLESRLGSDDDRLRKPAQLIESAEKWYSLKEFDRALRFAKDAQAAQLAVAKPRPKTTPAQPEQPKPTAGQPKSTQSESCRDARIVVDDARQTVRNADPRGVTNAELDSATALLRSAEDLLQTQQCNQARDLAKQARALIRVGDTTTPRRPPEVGAPPPVPGAPPLDQPSDSVSWKGAYDAQRRALERRDAAKEILTSAAQPIFDSGVESLDRARSHYQNKDYRLSEDAAKDAIEKFELAIAASEAAGGGIARKPVEPSQPEKPQQPTEPDAPGKTTSQPVQSGSVKARAEQAISAYEKSPGSQKTPSGWQGAYRQIISSLILRDQATPLAKTKAAKQALERGNASVAQARAAYGDKRYSAADELARSAAAEFQAIMDTQTPLSPQPEIQDDGSDAFKATDKALREAQVLFDVCEKEKCFDRDFMQFAKARQIIESARSAFKQRKYDYAKDLAVQAKSILEGVLLKPSAPQPAPQADPAEAQKKKLAAEDAMREANIVVKLCEQKACDKQNLEVWLRATSLMNSAKAAFADQLYERSTSQAEEARKILRDVLDAAPQGVVIPQGITRVRLDGDKLIAQPPLDFKAGSANLTENGKVTAAEIATVIKSNLDRLQGISIVGHTDSRGNPNLNRTLSANRAAAVLQSLSQAGIPTSLMTSEGRGADQPIADNSTDEGRRANRRVEIILRTK